MRRIRGLAANLAIVARLCAALLLWTQEVGADNEPTVGFLTWTTNDSSQPTVDSYTKLEVVSQCDDSPQEQVDLPFLFPFFGIAQQRAWVNGNGAVFFSAVPPCGAYFGSGDCSVDTSYKNALLGYATDLNAAASENASVSVGTSDGDACLVVRYDSLPQFGFPDSSETFRITLCEDGHIALSWDNVLGKATSTSHDVVAGVRGPDAIPYAFLTVEQLASKSSWTTPVNGLYPNRATMVNGATFHVCPVTREWCLAPDTVVLDDVDVAVSVSLTTFDISCLDIVTYGCRIESANLSEPLIVTAIAVNRTTISCEIPAELRTEPVQLDIWPIALSPTTADLVGDSLTLQVVSNSSGDTCDAQPAPEPACESCAICDEEYACFDLECAENSTNVFQHRDCSGTCGDDYYTDLSGECCDVSEIDCFGTCGGNAVSALMLTSADTQTLICCKESAVDCQGYCDGKAKPDVCGTCAGGQTGVVPDETGESCIPGFAVNPTELSFTADASIPDTWMIATIEVFNNNSIVVKWKAEIDPVSEHAPTVVLQEMPASNLLEPYETALVQVNVSMASLFAQQTYTWELKYVNIGFTVAEGTAFAFISLPVYVTTTECDNIAIQDTCAAAPGCIVCQTYDNPRSLRAINDGEETNEDDFYFVEPPQRRRAFNQLIPDTLGPATSKIDHYCRDGTTADACYIQSSPSTVPSYLSFVSLLLFVFFSLCS